MEHELEAGAIREMAQAAGRGEVDGIPAGQQRAPGPAAQRRDVLLWPLGPATLQGRGRGYRKA